MPYKSFYNVAETAAYLGIPLEEAEQGLRPCNDFSPSYRIVNGDVQNRHYPSTELSKYKVFRDRYGIDTFGRR